MTTLRSVDVGVLVHELVDSWPDRDGRVHRGGLFALLAVQTQPVHMTDRSEGGGHGKVTGSPPPWAADVESLITDIAAGARDHEITLRRLAGLGPVARDERGRPIPRGGTDRNTYAALHALPKLVGILEQRNPDLPKLAEVEVDLTRWHRAARVILGHDRKWARVPLICTAETEGAEPNEDGTPAICGKPAIRQRPRDGSFICTACGATWPEGSLGVLANATDYYEGTSA